MSQSSSTSAPDQGVFGRFPKMIAVAAASYYAIQHFGPVFYGAPFESQPNWPSFAAAGLLTGSVMAIASDICRSIASALELKANRTAEGNKGKARFAELFEIEDEITEDGLGPHWGAVDGRTITSEFASNALVLGPPGSEKSVGIVVPTILSIHGPKVVLDFKSELACVTSVPLAERGEKVIFLNVGDLNSDILGPSAKYNPLNLTADNFFREGGLRDVSNDISEFTHQISPEPQGGSGDNQTFDIGARELIGEAMIQSLVVDGFRSTLGDVASLLNNKERFLNHALWGCGRLPDENSVSGFAKLEFENSPWFGLHNEADQTDFIAHFRDQSTKVAQLLSNTESKLGDSFLTQAQQGLERFNRSTRAFNLTRSSSFRFSDLKESDQPITVFLIADPARMKAQERVLSLIQFCMYSEFLRHPNADRKIHVISEETSNFKIHGLI